VKHVKNGAYKAKLIYTLRELVPQAKIEERVVQATAYGMFQGLAFREIMA
jgi:hypothetical protein